MVDEILGVKFASASSNRPWLRISSNARLAIALFCSCKDEAKSDPAINNEQAPTVLISLMSCLWVVGWIHVCELNRTSIAALSHCYRHKCSGERQSDPETRRSQVSSGCELNQ